MLKKFLHESGNILISPVFYILVMASAATGCIFFGMRIIFGDGAAFLILGALLLIYTIALCRSVSSGQ